MLPDLFSFTIGIQKLNDKVAAVKHCMQPYWGVVFAKHTAPLPFDLKDACSSKKMLAADRMLRQKVTRRNRSLTCS